MKKNFDFDKLFIYDMANNHQGSVEHGLKIINEIAKVSNDEGVRGALKFQFRDLDTFIHPDYKKSKTPKHIPRFLSTRLSEKDFARLIEAVRKNKLITISTPFDEKSVDLIEKLGVELIKIPSCSANDWPLLEKVSKARKPVICSTGGLSIREIDNVVDFFERRDVHFALMHCVAIYPTPNKKLQLNQIETLCTRYPHITIGFSTHEEPNNFSAIKVAYAKGARIFERHIGIETKDIKLNAYSSRPDQIKKWIQAYKETVELCGTERRPPTSDEESSSLQSLKRGVFVKRDVSKGEILKENDVFFAMPLLDEKLEISYWFPGMIAEKNYKKNEPLTATLALQKKRTTRVEIIKEVILEVKGMLNDARIAINKDSQIELSHHYGIERFREYGAIIVNCINRIYCKKLVIQLPSQTHPYHYHKRKEETFQVLFGDLEIELDGHRFDLSPGDMIQINEGQWHKFKTLNGVIFEEVSTTHYDNDSFYKDKQISLMPRDKRKTLLTNVGKNVFLYEEEE